MKVIYTQRAREDIFEIGSYIANFNDNAARKLVKKIKTTVLKLSDIPHMGRKGRFKNTRELMVTQTPYIIVYRTLETRVEILAIIHGARNFEVAFLNT